MHVWVVSLCYQCLYDPVDVIHVCVIPVDVIHVIPGELTMSAAPLAGNV